VCSCSTRLGGNTAGFFSDGVRRRALAHCPRLWLNRRPRCWERRQRIASPRISIAAAAPASRLTVSNVKPVAVIAIAVAEALAVVNVMSDAVIAAL
jgi:hypothetical protein